MRRAGLYIDKAGKKGRGVFTEKSIPANTEIEIAPVIVLSEADRKQIEGTKLFFYIFEWGEDAMKGIVALGYVSMYNHASPSNCEYEMDYEKETITIRTTRKIAAGEEVTINYSAGHDDWTPVFYKEEKQPKAKKTAKKTAKKAAKK
jgi:SET domain-containing protein